MRSEKEVREEQRKAQARVERWNESVAKAQALQAAWQKENEEKFGPFLKKF